MYAVCSGVKVKSSLQDEIQTYRSWNHFFITARDIHILLQDKLTYIQSFIHTHNHIHSHTYKHTYTYHRHDPRVTHKAHYQQPRHQIYFTTSMSCTALCQSSLGLFIWVSGDVQEMIEGVAHQEPPFKAYSATHPSPITVRHQTAHWFGNTFDRDSPWILAFFAKERKKRSERLGFEACEMLMIMRVGMTILIRIHIRYLIGLCI